MTAAVAGMIVDVRSNINIYNWLEKIIKKLLLQKRQPVSSVPVSKIFH